MIGLLTAIIGDLASIFGCLVGVEDAITAITFVALGTSMPDTFASMLAATAEPTADSSVGNVNGSNSVNVFLGLGLPWMISSIYWHIMEGRPHYVPAGSLGFSVVVFSTMALLAILILMVRRFTLGAELGGPKIPKYISGFLLVCLWGSYVLLSILKAKGVIQFHVV
nr:hypothetical protein BaRGS_031462 [Batillaria attramentaria]